MSLSARSPKPELWDTYMTILWVSRLSIRVLPQLNFGFEWSTLGKTARSISGFCRTPKKGPRRVSRSDERIRRRVGRWSIGASCRWNSSKNDRPGAAAVVWLNDVGNKYVIVDGRCCCCWLVHTVRSVESVWYPRSFWCRWCLRGRAMWSGLHLFIIIIFCLSFEHPWPQRPRDDCKNKPDSNPIPHTRP